MASKKKNTYSLTPNQTVWLMAYRKLFTYFDNGNTIQAKTYVVYPDPDKHQLYRNCTRLVKRILQEGQYDLWDKWMMNNHVIPTVELNKKWVTKEYKT